MLGDSVTLVNIQNNSHNKEFTFKYMGNLRITWSNLIHKWRTIWILNKNFLGVTIFSPWDHSCSNDAGMSMEKVLLLYSSLTQNHKVLNVGEYFDLL